VVAGRNNTHTVFSRPKDGEARAAGRNRAAKADRRLRVRKVNAGNLAGGDGYAYSEVKNVARANHGRCIAKSRQTR
jgi:hypothetical protein